VGTPAAPSDVVFPEPFVVDSAQIFHIGLRIPTSTLSGGSFIRGLANVTGFLE